MTASVRGVIAAAQFALLGGLLLVAGIVALRRLAGGPSFPLTEIMLAATGAAFAAACLVGRLVGLRWLGRSAPSWLDRAAAFVPLASCGLLIAGVLLPGTALAGGCLLVALLAVEETWSLSRLPWRRALGRDGVGSQFRDQSGLGLESASGVAKLTPDPLASASDETVDQQFTRRRAPDGEEVIEGFVRVRFAAGQRTAEAHIAFCPPLEHRPRVEFEAESGPAARIELGQVLPLGARLDVKLAQAAAQETAIVVRFTATAESKAVVGSATSRCA